MQIHRSCQSARAGETSIPAVTLQDNRLSWAARGILAQLLTYPDGTEVNADQLWAQSAQRGQRGSGRRTVRAAFAELEVLGYMVRRKVNGPQGLIITHLDVYDTPGHAEPDDPTTVLRSPRRQYLYRHWDDRDCLLYVGVTDDPRRRQTAHAKTSPWFSYVATTTVEEFVSRRDAEQAEDKAIRTESPVFNTAGNDDTREVGERLDWYLTDRAA